MEFWIVLTVPTLASGQHGRPGLIVLQKIMIATKLAFNTDFDRRQMTSLARANRAKAKSVIDLAGNLGVSGVRNVTRHLVEKHIPARIRFQLEFKIV